MDLTRFVCFKTINVLSAILLVSVFVISQSLAYFQPQISSSDPSTITGTISSEHFQYKSPTQYSYATILGQRLASSIARCASACKRNPACDGFYYSLYHPICYLGATFIKRQTTYVDPAAYRLYLMTSYVLPPVCPGYSGYQLITTPEGKSFCLRAYDESLKYFEAQTKCQENGGSLMYLEAHLSGNIQYLNSFLDQLGSSWNSGWGGAYQEAEESATWLWSYGGAEMTSLEYGSLYLVVLSGLSVQKCIEFNAAAHSLLKEALCTHENQFICEIVLF